MGKCQSVRVTPINDVLEWGPSSFPTVPRPCQSRHEQMSSCTWKSTWDKLGGARETSAPRKGNVGGRQFVEGALPSLLLSFFPSPRAAALRSEKREGWIPDRRSRPAGRPRPRPGRTFPSAVASKAAIKAIDGKNRKEERDFTLETERCPQGSVLIGGIKSQGSEGPNLKRKRAPF